MNDNGDSSDGMDELYDIIAEYEEKAKQNKTEPAKAEIAKKVKGSKEKKKNIKMKKGEPKTEPAKTEIAEEEKGSKEIKNIKNKKEKCEFAKSEDEEVPMDKMLFGDKNGLIKRLAKAANAAPDEVKDETKADNDATDKGKKRPAWTDDDDENIIVGDVKRTKGKYTNYICEDKTYKEVLTSKFTRLQTQPKWATSARNRKSENDSDDEELLRTVGFIAKPSGAILAPKELQYKKLKDLNRATYTEGNITSIEFHPTSTAALVAGKTGKASIFSVDGGQNEKLHTISFKNFPITCARIMPCGTKAIFGSVRRHYYMYDLLTAQEQSYPLRKEITTLWRFEVSPCGNYMAAVGRFGEMHLFHAKSHEILHSFKMSDTVIDLCFTGNSQQIICNSKRNTVSIFSLRQQRLEHSFFDDGCISGSAIDLSPNQRMLATGSEEGVVNVYDFDKLQKTTTPKPAKVFMNLTTGISHVKFNHSSELLGFCSNKTNNAVKIAHFPSATVYANFPSIGSDLGNVSNISFSPNGGYCALGAYRKAPLIRLKHFNNY